MSTSTSMRCASIPYTAALRVRNKATPSSQVGLVFLSGLRYPHYETLNRFRWARRRKSGAVEDHPVPRRIVCSSEGRSRPLAVLIASPKQIRSESKLGGSQSPCLVHIRPGGPMHVPRQKTRTVLGELWTRILEDEIQTAAN